MRGRGHTPGPWELIRNYNETRIVGIGAKRLRMKLVSVEQDDCATREDLRLMAAAPEMVDALQAAIEFLDGVIGPGREDEVRKIITDAIAKAEGRDE